MRNINTKNVIIWGIQDILWHYTIGRKPKNAVVSPMISTNLPKNQQPNCRSWVMGIERWWFQYYDRGNAGRKSSLGLARPVRNLALIVGY
jgi:hypothetical protein